MNVYLAGMIGSGKTTIGTATSARTGLPFADLDQEMNRRLGYSFHQLVAEQGWLPFRELEYDICRDFAQRTGTIICLGGGTVRYRWNRDVLAGTGPIILLEARVETLIARVSRADRPRVNRDTDLAGDIERMWREHAKTYRAAATHTIHTDDLTLDEEVRAVYEIIRTIPGLEETPPPAG